MKKFKFLLVAILFALVLFAVAACNSDEVELNFETNGGNQIESVKVKIGDNYTLPVPTRSGYEFDGWYTDEQFSGSAVESIEAKEDATFYAKWTQVFTVTLDLDGGALSSSSLTLRAGTNLYNAVENLIPTKANHQFGGWYRDGSALASGTLMPEANVTLQARYKVAYTVEIYLQDAADETKYEKAEQDVVGYDWAGTKVEPDEKVVGFERVIGHELEVAQKELSDNPAENVFKIYYNRQTINVIFDANYPNTEKEDQIVLSVKYGEEVTVPVNFSEEGSYLYGWTSDGGQTVYKTNIVESLVRNDNSGVEYKPDSFIPEEDIVLYGVWNEGYVDMFGGEDYIYLSMNQDNMVYLYRGGEYFVGEINDKTNEFLFRNNSDEIILKGKINENKTFSYSDTIRNNSSYSLFEVGVGVNESKKIIFDEFNGIEYYEEENGQITVRMSGYYDIDSETGIYTAHFDDTTFKFIVGTVSGQKAFQIRNEEEFALGRDNGDYVGLVRFAISEGNLVYYTEVYHLLLDGFGNAAMNMGDSTQSYRYTYDAELQRITLLNSMGMVVGVCQIMSGTTTQGYMLYDQQTDNVFTSKSSDATLTLDGLYNATYFDGTKSITGVYYIEKTSVLGGSIVKFIYEDGAVGSEPVTFTFIIQSETVDSGSVDEAGKPVMTTNFYFEKKHNGYAEYFYKDGNPEIAYYYSPVLVVNDTAEGKASVYGYITSNKQYKKVSEGTLIYNPETKLYMYTAERYFDAPEVTTNPFDLSKVKSFIYDLGIVNMSSGAVNVSYWYSVTTVNADGGEDITTEFEVKNYTSQGATLRLVSGFAIYTLENGNFISATYTLNGNIVVISTSAGSLYLEINDVDSTFITLTTPPYTAKEIMEDNKISNNSTLTFDGKGGATYTLKGEPEVVHVGSVTKTTEVTAFGAEIYQFTSDGLQFKFIQLFTSSANLFTRYNENYVGDYRSADGGRITLDGYGYQGEYFDSNDGTTSKGIYYIAEENVVCMIFDDVVRYFDLKENKQFTVRGLEYGAHILMDNQNISGIYVEFDGYGKLSVFTIDSETQERAYIDQNGTYTIDGEDFTLTYTDGNKEINLVGKRSILIISSQGYNVFVVSYKEVARIYINEVDFSVLVLNEIGGAVRYDKNGVKQVGEYLIITDTMLYYASTQSEDACIYIYDDEKGTATPINFRERGYYTPELDSLQFTKYGFAIFNGETRYYYNVVDNNVVIYRRANATGETLPVNKYGFVEVQFGPFNDEVQFEGKTYILNSGFELVFKREDATKEKYPVPMSNGNETYYRPLEDLRFTPTGKINFNVSGVVTIDGTDYNCTVTKTETEMYVTVQYFRFYIEATYSGDNNIYKVVGMENRRTLPAYTYLYLYYMYAMLAGPSAAANMPNTWGVISLVSEYNDAGTVTKKYIIGDFGSDSGMIDSNGNIVSFNTEDYTLDEASGMYTVNFKAEDGYNYKLYFAIAPFSQLQTSGYQVFALTRVESVMSGEYKIEVERVITSEANMAMGAFFKVSLYKNDTLVEYTDIYATSPTKVYYVVREKTQEGKITGTTYYIIEFTEKAVDSGVAEGEAAVKNISLIESASVKMETIETIYTQDGLSYVDISATDGVLMMTIVEKDEGTGKETTHIYFITKSSYDVNTTTYTINTSANKTFTIKVNEAEGSKTVVITEVPQEDQPSQEQDLAA